MQCTEFCSKPSVSRQIEQQDGPSISIADRIYLETHTDNPGMVKITKDCPSNVIEELGIQQWPIWSCEASTFPWTYEDKETCLILEGSVTVTPEGGEPVDFSAGDLVEFPKGMSCIWHVKQAVRKHYQFG